MTNLKYLAVRAGEEPTLLMSVEEAASMTGYAPWTIRQFCNKGMFTAEKPRGNKGGWMILRPSLEKWEKERRRSTTNTEARK